MELSLMSFSFMGDIAAFRMNADKLCRVAKENGISCLDLMTFEVRLYGVRSLKKALAKHGVRCGCLIATLPFYSGVERFPMELERAFSLCEQLGVKDLMVVPRAFSLFLVLEWACTLHRKLLTQFIFFQLIPDILRNSAVILSCCVYVVPPTPEFSVSVFVLQFAELLI